MDLSYYPNCCPRKLELASKQKVQLKKKKEGKSWIGRAKYAAKEYLPPPSKMSGVTFHCTKFEDEITSVGFLISSNLNQTLANRVLLISRILFVHLATQKSLNREMLTFVKQGISNNLCLQEYKLGLGVGSQDNVKSPRGK